MTAPSGLFCGCFESLSDWYSWIAHWREDVGEMKKSNELFQPKHELFQFKPSNQTSVQNQMFRTKSDVNFRTNIRTKPDFRTTSVQNQTLTTQFSDLPDDVLKMIIERITLDDRPKIREVSRRLRILSDSLPFEVEQVKYKCDFEDSTVYLGNRKFHYEHGVDHTQPALNQLYLLLNIPNLRLNTLSIKISDTHQSRWFRKYTWILCEFDCLLASLQKQIPVKNLSVRFISLDLLQMILPVLKPGILKSITSSDLEHDYFTPQYYQEKQYDIADVEKISKLKQWKLAKELTMSNCLASTIQVDTKGCFSNFKTWKVDAPCLDSEFALLRSCMKKMNEHQVLMTPSIACLLFDKFCTFLGPNTEMLNENSAVYEENGAIFDVKVDREMNVIITRRAAV
ncbi:hypothetical protein CAEBREN_13166 [Caenorhabditis brenneri]|uniref:F-box domain-containing protein n=1 Tax=Caenorhabditis brenneri TaxID=135651 RepID=G0N0Z3_CAEBE|nr:hypothetical protein CAEBREN_13166 [Caenorhabditis brenneri]